MFLLIISYLFLVLSQSVQAIFAKAYSTPEEAPPYFSTPLKMIIPFSAIGVTFIHFNELFPYDIHMAWKIIIHIAIAILASAFLQTFYLKSHGLSKDSALHVFFFLFTGYVLLGLWYFFY